MSPVRNSPPQRPEGRASAGAISNGVRVLQISADRSTRGLLHRDSPAFKRQEAYAKEFGDLDIIAFSRRSDGAGETNAGALRIFPTNSRSPLWYGIDAIRIAKKLPRPDIITAQDPFETGLAAWWIARRLEVPLHVQVHTDFVSAGYGQHSLLNRLRVSIARFTLGRAARVRAVSKRIKEALETSGIQVPITVLPIYVDVEGLRRTAPPALAARFARFAKRILIVSRLEREKNVALGISAFALSAPKDACLIIVGSGSERSRLERQAKEWNISDRVFFEGEQPAASYYTLADLLLVTSFYEGYGLVIIEALAAGKPVLSTDVGVAREAGAIIASPKEFAAALKQWFEIGSKVGRLNNYPYRNFDEYVHEYCADVAAAAKKIDSR